MDGPGGPKTNSPRTSLVDAGWDSDPATEDVTITDAEPIEVRPVHSTIDLDEHEVQTVSMPAHALRQLTEDGPSNVQARGGPNRGPSASFDLEGDSAVDDLLESEEGRRLESTAPPGRARPGGTGHALPPRQVAANVPPPPLAPPQVNHIPRETTAASPLPSFEDGPPLPAFDPPTTRAPTPPPASSDDPAASSPVPATFSAPAPSSPQPPEPTYVPPRNPPARLVGAGDDDRTHPGARAASDGKAAGSSGGLIAMILGVSLPLAVGAGIWIGKTWFSTSPAVAETPSPPPSAAAPPTPEPPEALSTVDRARNGDFDAIEKLEQKAPTERTAAETLALAEGRSHNKQLALKGFKNKIEEDPSLLTSDKSQLLRLRDFIEDRETTNEAAAIAAGLETPIGPDLLYEVWVGVKERTETTELAEQLVYSTTVRKYASPALKVALDLREAETCDEYEDILPRAYEHGDRRSLHLLGKLLKKHGCGADKTGDCYACLRPLDEDEDSIGVVDAIREVRQRPAPKLR